MKENTYWIPWWTIECLLILEDRKRSGSEKQNGRKIHSGHQALKDRIKDLTKAAVEENMQIGPITTNESLSSSAGANLGPSYQPSLTILKHPIRIVPILSNRLSKASAVQRTDSTVTGGHIAHTSFVKVLLLTAQVAHLVVVPQARQDPSDDLAIDLARRGKVDSKSFCDIDLAFDLDSKDKLVL